MLAIGSKNLFATGLLPFLFFSFYNRWRMIQFVARMSERAPVIIMNERINVDLQL